MKRVCVFTILAGVSLFAAIAVAQEGKSETANSPAKAVVPRLIRFGGVLKDVGAKPLHGVQDVTFSLYAIEAGGEPLWFETQTVEADALGRYSVLLGAASSDGLPMDLFTSGEARWLGVSVGRLPDQPRILLVAVPYALKAADADTLGGKPATAFVASDQLKEQVQSEVKAQVTESGSPTRTLVGTSPTPQVIAETSPATFTCATSGVCVQTSQSGAGGIALRAAAGSATGTAGIFDNLGGGKILSGRTTGYAEKFYVDGSGNLWAGGAIVANSYAGTSGAAVFGVVTAATGAAYGVRGQSASVSGVGVFGYGTSPTGLTYGVLGANLSASGTGLSGSASSPTGVTIGVRAVSQSPNGTAAIFDNLGGGKLISARTTGYVEKFSVAGNGNVVTSGSVNASGSLITGSTVVAGGFMSTLEYIAMPLTSNPGVGVIRIGGSPFIHAYGTENTFVGANAGNFTTTGGGNTASGWQALFSNTTGVGNTAGGYAALVNNTTGYANTASGGDALFHNTTGYDNTGSGVYALYSNTDGNANTAIGRNALYWNSTAYSNTAVGGYALNRNCVTVVAGCPANNNTALGYYAGDPLDVTHANDTGSSNTFLGAYSGPGTSTQLDNATAIGANAVVSASNTLVLGSINGVNGATADVNVGIGTTTPAQRLEINGGMRLNTGTARPACNAGIRGTFWLTQEGTGVADSFDVCVKDNADAYVWQNVF